MGSSVSGASRGPQVVPDQRQGIRFARCVVVGQPGPNRVISYGRAGSVGAMVSDPVGSPRAAQTLHLLHPNPARGPGRRRGRQPPPARARLLRPPGRPRGVHLAAAGPADAAQDRGHRAPGDGRHGRPGGPLPGPPAGRALSGHRALGRLRPHPVQAPRPQGRGLPAGPHPRGDVHSRGQGPLLLLQGPAGHRLPDPDQVPRRGPPPRRHHPRPRVRHEGLLLLRHRRRRPGRRLPGPPRHLRADLHPPGPGLRHRQRHGRRHGRIPLRGVPPPLRDR